MSNVGNERSEEVGMQFRGLKVREQEENETYPGVKSNGLSDSLQTS